MHHVVKLSLSNETNTITISNIPEYPPGGTSKKIIVKIIKYDK